MSTEPTGTYLTLDDGRPAVRFTRTYDHPVGRVWQFVTEPGSWPTGSRPASRSSCVRAARSGSAATRTWMTPPGASSRSTRPGTSPSAGAATNCTSIWRSWTRSAPVSPSPTSWRPRTRQPATAPAGRCASPPSTRTPGELLRRPARGCRCALAGGLPGVRRGRRPLRSPDPGTGRLTPAPAASGYCICRRTSSCSRPPVSANSWAGGPCWATRPSSITMTRSASMHGGQAVRDHHRVALRAWCSR